MHISELDYDLPESLIAQFPSERRDGSRLMVVDRAKSTIHLDVYRNVAQYLHPGDCMVLNRTRVVRARLRGTRASGGKVEVFLLHEIAPGSWEALVRPSAKLEPGSTVSFGPANATIEDRLGDGRRRVVFDTPDVLRVMEQTGHVPLPPYIRRGHDEPNDATRYQTIYALEPGSVAAPTAGLHFTDDVFNALDAKGVRRTTITLHVGYGTFSPIRAEQVEDHQLEPEEFEVSEESARLLNETRARGGRVIAVGTTSTRVLESQFADGQYRAGAGQTAHYIHPPYTFRAVDALQTNFHLPRSSLLALVYAFAGKDLAREAYQRAIADGFRFYSYGDVMLIV